VSAGLNSIRKRAREDVECGGNPISVVQSRHGLGTHEVGKSSHNAPRTVLSHDLGFTERPDVNVVHRLATMLAGLTE